MSDTNENGNRCRRVHKIGFKTKSIVEFTPDYDKIAKLLGDPTRPTEERAPGWPTQSQSRA
jgi:hypothetical protein